MYYSRVSRNVDVFLENIFLMYQDHSSTHKFWAYHPWSPDPRWFLLQLGHPHHPHMAQQDTLRRSLGWEAIPSRWLCPTFLRIRKWWKHPRIGGVICPQIIRDWQGLVVVGIQAARAHRHRPVCPELPSRRWLARRCRNDRKGHQHAPWRQIMWQM